MTYLLLIIGLAMLLAGANYLVDASVAIAKRAKISNFIIGITIVGMGTSLPELFVSASSAIDGYGDMSVGNIVGSNICNIFLILGITAIIAPFAVTRQNLVRDIPFGVFASILLLLLCSDKIFPRIECNEIGRMDSIVFLLIFIGYITFAIYQSHKEQQSMKENEEIATSSLTGRPAALLWTIAIVSLAVLLYGGNLFLDNVVAVAKLWGMSEKVISLTIVAVGTSLPELITCIIAATKNNPQLALGNVIGSNIFNILFILGFSAMLKPIQLAGINYADFGVMILASVLTFVCAFTFKKRMIDRTEGIIFVAIYILYTAYLLIWN